jgi:formate-dependent nitrite reductase membrane component NrfD
MSESNPQYQQLRQTLERTNFRASLAPEYVTGEAPGAQRKDGHASPENPDYYGIPAIKKANWKPYVPAYFFVGGVSAGAYIVAALADLIGRREDLPIVRAGRIIALLGMIISPILLIVDLGRPDRWFNMLRVFRPRSMMNMGSYGLVVFGVFSGLAVVLQGIQDLIAPRSGLARVVVLPLRLISWLGVIPAVFVGTYTGLLLAATNVPLWAGNRLLMGPLFFSSAMATGIAAIKLTAPLFGTVTEPSKERLKLAESVIATTELALVAGSKLILGDLAKPLTSGPIGWSYQIGSVGLGLIAPLVLQKIGGQSWLATKLSPALTLLGGVVMRFAFTKGGDKSADDPHAYFAYTKSDGNAREGV